MARVKPKGRPRLGGRGRHVNQYKLQAESVGKKLAVLAHLKRTRDARVTILHSTQPSSLVVPKQARPSSPLASGAKQLEEAASAHKEEHKKIREVGEHCVWINELREEGVPVSTTMLTFKARDLAYDANVKGFEPLTNGWTDLKDATALPTGSDSSGPAEYSVRVTSIMQDLGIKRVYNADRTCNSFLSAI
ncbi:Homeodomain-like [Phytophthora cactorum]|nr:Homeodomain-like [Phytophthora cactorum]